MTAARTPSRLAGAAGAAFAHKIPVTVPIPHGVPDPHPFPARRGTCTDHRVAGAVTGTLGCYGADRSTTMSSHGDIEAIEAEVAYYRDRLALMRAKQYSRGVGATPRMEDLQRRFDSAERRLKIARAASPSGSKP